MNKSNLERRILQVLVTGAAALALLIALPVLVAQSAGQAQAQPCYNGIIPGNPYIPSCNFPPRQPKPPGGTPDQAAVIACHDVPGCLSWYINGPH
jgi:hypothetical protein